LKSTAGAYKLRKQNGFSIIELLVVVAIILIIAAIAIPNLLRAHMAANEASAVGSVRTINTGEVTYAAAYPTVGYAYALTNLGGAAPCANPSASSACVIDDLLATAAIKSGYSFKAVGAGGGGSVTAPTAPNTVYLVTGLPTADGITGTRGFCSDQSGVIYYNTNGGAISTDAICAALAVAQ
jgi:prepilin-type N-terminal cleavage/methylation domain-containing protein